MAGNTFNDLYGPNFIGGEFRNRAVVSILTFYQKGQMHIDILSEIWSFLEYGLSHYSCFKSQMIPWSAADCISLIVGFDDGLIKMPSL